MKRSQRTKRDRPELPEIVISLEMIESGVKELREHQIGEDLREVVQEVYAAMEYARRRKPSLGEG